jgi:hypothetical protein
MPGVPEGAADDPAAIRGDESDDNSDARLDRTEENSAEPVEITGVDNTTLEMDQQYGESTHEHKLRPRRPRDYNHMHARATRTCHDDSVLDQEGTGGSQRRRRY